MTENDSSTVRDWLRGIEVFTRRLPEFATESAPAEPSSSMG
ncbi:hypothetical protein ACFVZH_07440 [Streptomyces sp. NPDC059534]